MKKQFILAVAVASAFLVAMILVFHMAASETAKHETYAYEQKDKLYNLAYLSYLRHGFNKYLPFWLIKNEETFPFSWLKGKHQDIYKSFVSDSKNIPQNVYADFLFYIKPCNECLVNDDERVRKGILILKQLANMHPESFIPPHGFILAAETYHFALHLNAKNYSFTRKEYYHALTNSWLAFKKFSPFISNENPNNFWLMLRFYFSLLKRVGYILDKEGVINIGCSNPLISTFQEMHRELPYYSQLALDDFHKKDEIPLKLSHENVFIADKGDMINSQIHNNCSKIGLK